MMKLLLIESQFKTNITYKTVNTHSHVQTFLVVFFQPSLSLSTPSSSNPPLIWFINYRLTQNFACT